MALGTITRSDAVVFPAAPDDGDCPAALTPRGEAAILLIRLEDAWAELGPADRAYFAGVLEDLARQAREVGS